MFTFSKNFGLAAAIDAKTASNLRMLRMYVDDSCITALRQEVAVIDQLRDKGTTELKPEEFAKAFGLPMPTIHTVVVCIPKDEDEKTDAEDMDDDAKKDQQPEGGRRGGRRQQQEAQERRICERSKEKKPEMVRIPYTIDAIEKSRLMDMIKMAFQAKRGYSMSDHVACRIIAHINYNIKNTSNRSLMRNIAEILAKEDLLG